MTVDIWSDVMCPFCYIGKRKFEKALNGFERKDEVQVRWRSFQLDPNLNSDGSTNLFQYLADRKGWSLEYSKKAHEQLTAKAAAEGLNYQFEKAVPANSFNAHRLSHLAADFGCQEAVEELIFAAYFTHGQNIDDIETLIGIAAKLGIDQAKAREALSSDTYAAEVKKDILLAQDLGVQGVPFFVFDNKYAVSGAQDSSVFARVLEQVFTENDQTSTALPANENVACDVNGNC